MLRLIIENMDDGWCRGEQHLLKDLHCLNIQIRWSN